MIEEVQKTQLGRINSILIFSPIMFYLATRTTLTRNDKILATVIGIGTFVTVFYAWNENRKTLNKLEE